MLFEIEARELYLFAKNDRTLYCSYLEPIEQNFIKKAKKGTFNADKACGAYVVALRDAAKRYCRMFGGDWMEVFPAECRRTCAKMFVDKFVNEMPYLLEA